MTDPPVLIAYGPCWLHGGIFAFDPGRVVTILIDPVSDNPPDVDAQGHALDPDTPLVRERVERSVQVMLCPACCRKLNAAARARGLPARFDETDTSAGQVQQ